MINGKKKDGKNVFLWLNKEPEEYLKFISLQIYCIHNSLSFKNLKLHQDFNSLVFIAFSITSLSLNDAIVSLFRAI